MNVTDLELVLHSERHQRPLSGIGFTWKVAEAFLAHAPVVRGPHAETLRSISGMQRDMTRPPLTVQAHSV